MIDSNSIIEKLKTVNYPGYSRDIVSFGLIHDVQIENSKVKISLKLNSPSPEVRAYIMAECKKAVESISGVSSVDIINVSGGQSQSTKPNSNMDPWQSQKRINGVKKVIAIASGKGGVGKSTVAVNIACALSKLGLKTGLLDCDIYGPTVPLMMGIRQMPDLNERERIIPPLSHGVKLMSIGFMVDPDAPIIWRGPMLGKVIQQFLHDVEWGELDFLIVDLPPGTGDAQLSLAQNVPIDGGIIVTTPQEASISIVRKGIGMFEKINVPIIGIIENMSYFTTPNGERIEIFGHGGGLKEAESKNIPFLGQIPIFTEIRESCDKGTPIATNPDLEPAKVFFEIAEKINKQFN
jgi:ATP-binding protein involved in chromosome partitioning